MIKTVLYTVLLLRPLFLPLSLPPKYIPYHACNAATIPPTIPPIMAATLSGYRQKEHLTESQSFDWTGLHQHTTHYLLLFTIAQDKIHSNNEVELLVND